MVIIGYVGSRDFDDLDLVDREVDADFALYGKDLFILSGGADGVDKRSIKRAKELGVPYEEELPDFKKNNTTYKVGDYHARNARIAERSFKVKAFWDRKSPGTKSTIDACFNKGKRVEIFFGKKKRKGNFRDLSEYL